MLTIKICCRLSGSAACNMLLHSRRQQKQQQTQSNGQTDRQTDRQVDRESDGQAVANRVYLHAGEWVKLLKGKVDGGVVNFLLYTLHFTEDG